MEAEVAHVANEVVKESLLGSFGVNWKIFLAQLANFGVVLLVLWKWVFTPAMKAIDTRQKEIAKGLEDAKQAAADRTNAGEEKDAVIISARKEAQKIMEAASVDAEKLRKETAEKTQKDVADIVAQGKANLADEKEKIVIDAKKEIADLVIASTEKVLAETNDDKRQHGLIQAAVKKLIG